MRKGIIICAAAVVLALAGCSDYVDTDESKAVVSGTTDGTTVSSGLDISSQSVPQYLTITAEVTGYKDGKMSFTYEGKHYEVPCSKESFIEDSPTNYPTLSERIINNRYGEDIKGRLKLTGNMDEVLYCDVVTPNGAIYTGINPLSIDGTVNRDMLYSLRRGEGSVCTVTNSKETLTFDLNDLEMFWKLDYPDVIDPVMFKCFKFRSGNAILEKLYYNVTATDKNVGSDIREEDIDKLGKRLCFFGTVQSISEDGGIVTFILNDGKTLCTVPMYYSDGTELHPGMEVMVTLIADSTLFGSGGEHRFDYAVISADAAYYNKTGSKDIIERRIIKVNGEESTGKELAFSELAYAEYEGAVYFRYTTVEKASADILTDKLS